MNLAYYSKTSGIGGEIKKEPEDFVVEEIAGDGSVLEVGKRIEREDKEGDFTHFVLQKRNWNTPQALREISNKLGVGRKRFSFAGTKDRNAVTVQLCSAYKIPPEKILALELKDVEINGAWKSDKELRMGGLLGNRFKIMVRGAESNSEGRVGEIMDELGRKIVNYFGEQRFGSVRRNTHLVGREILRNDFNSAVMNFLSYFDEKERNEKAREARKELSETGDFGKALKGFPKYLKYERAVLSHLAKEPKDFVGALQKIPRSISLMFVHAYQSHLFNMMLSERVEEGQFEKESGEYLCGENFYGFPEVGKKEGGKWLVCKILGYESEPNEREEEILEREGVHISDFKIGSFPQLSSKGSWRSFFTPLKDFSFSKDTFSFELSSGSYATAALREFLDVKGGEGFK